jgi:hypothetical protein
LRAQQRDPKRADTRKRKYYRNAYHIYLEYLGQQRLVADISGEENAEKFLRALNAVDRIIHKTDFSQSSLCFAPVQWVSSCRAVE